MTAAPEVTETADAAAPQPPPVPSLWPMAEQVLAAHPEWSGMYAPLKAPPPPPEWRPWPALAGCVPWTLAEHQALMDSWWRELAARVYEGTRDAHDWLSGPSPHLVLSALPAGPGGRRRHARPDDEPVPEVVAEHGDVWLPPKGGRRSAGEDSPPALPAGEMPPPGDGGPDEEARQDERMARFNEAHDAEEAQHPHDATTGTVAMERPAEGEL